MGENEVSNPRILVVDDEMIVCESCKPILEEDGYEVETALRGREVIFGEDDMSDLTLSFPCLMKNPKIKNKKGRRIDENLFNPFHAFLFLHFFC